MDKNPDHVGKLMQEWQRERPDLDVTPQGVIGRLHRVAALLTHELTTVFERHGLAEGEFDVLAALRRAGAPFERAPGQLAAHTMVTTGAMTKRVDRLVTAGLVTRRLSESDRRGRVVALTAAGLTLINTAFEDHITNEHRLLVGLSATEREQLAGILSRWLATLEPHG